MEGLIYKVDCTNNAVDLVESQVYFRDIYVKNGIVALQSDDCVYELDKYCRNFSINKTDYWNFYDYYLQKYNILFKTIQISSNGFLVTKQVVINPNYKQGKDSAILIIEEKNVHHEKYERVFEEINGIGKGGFGEVYKVRRKSDNNCFAIKRIEVLG